MFELAFLEEGNEQVVPIGAEGVVLGRSPECDVVIKDFGVSRRHAEVVVDGDHCRLVDLKSKNGTQVNGMRVLEVILNDGDEILLGKFLVQFRKTLDEQVVLDEEKPMLEEAGTVIRSVGELSKYILEGDTGAHSQAGLRSAVSTPELSREAGELGKINRILRSLSGLAKALLSAQPEEVPARVMDAVFEHIPADRGFLMLYDEERNLKPKVVHHRHGHDEKITISKTIADRVVQDRVAILTSDAQVDPRFAAGDSIRFHGIRSAMCVPLWRGDAVIGIIHVDSPMQTKTFTPDDLELLTALGNYAAVAIQQASLNKKVQEEKIARERLEKYFSPAVATRILSEGEKEAQELEATVLFTDIVGFTQLAESMDAPSVAQLLNEIFSRMSEPILESDGTLDKFIGDCIMAVFGAPYPQTDHAVRAVRVALEMRNRLNELNGERGGGDIRVRTGMNSGPVLSGPIGSMKRKEITVLGDTVNIASRIESMVAGADQIVIGERTYELVKGQFEVKDMGTVALRGRKESVRVYEVIGEKVH
ncbi:MAG TPA: adenylate/guanylate cyclase domain-containing protein [Vicinamibacteria bacterium]|nr:adenylate/guanylate cyclase domain-containing protein [Vicinamibacteria bacterium]